MITIKDAEKIIEKINNGKKDVFVNDVLIVAFSLPGVNTEFFAMTHDDETLAFWRAGVVVASIDFKHIKTIETVDSVYNIKEGRWE